MDVVDQWRLCSSDQDQTYLGFCIDLDHFFEYNMDILQWSITINAKFVSLITFRVTYPSWYIIAHYFNVLIQVSHKPRSNRVDPIQFLDIDEVMTTMSAYR